jgi:hypothetical protein
LKFRRNRRSPPVFVVRRVGELEWQRWNLPNA